MVVSAQVWMKPKLQSKPIEKNIRWPILGYYLHGDRYEGEQWQYEIRLSAEYSIFVKWSGIEQMARFYWDGIIAAYYPRITSPMIMFTSNQKRRLLEYRFFCKHRTLGKSGKLMSFHNLAYENEIMRILTPAVECWMRDIL